MKYLKYINYKKYIYQIYKNYMTFFSIDKKYFFIDYKIIKLSKYSFILKNINKKNSLSNNENIHLYS